VLIASVSDLHTDFEENREVLVKLAASIYERSPSLVIVAGDVSHKNDRIDRALRALSHVAERVAYIPGNHDLWFDVPFAPGRRDLNTWVRYREELRDVAAAAGAHYLPAEPLVLHNVAVVGTCGWYDYSLAPAAIRTSIGDSALASKQFGGVLWSDARFIAFRDDEGELMEDRAVARAMERDLEVHLSLVSTRADVEHAVVVTHHQAFDEVVHHTGTLPWEFFNAFMGSSALGRVIQGAPKVRAAIYGHTHIVGDHRIDDLRVFGTPLGYPRERKGMSLDDVIRSRIGWIEIG
jgi:predicted phosphodiesterase